MKLLFLSASILFLSLQVNAQMSSSNQEWLTNPKIEDYLVPKTAFRQCMQTEIVKQASLSPSQKIFWIGTLLEELNSSKLTGLFCILDDRDFCKQSFSADIETSDPEGWKLQVINSTNIAISASTLGRFMTFRPKNQGEATLILDIMPCAQFFGIKPSADSEIF